MLGRLAGAGYKISLDDFGKGYSSLSRLRQLPVQVLKIDRLFVQELPDADAVALVSAIISMARSIEVDVVAEGVETEEQAAFPALGFRGATQNWSRRSRGGALLKSLAVLRSRQR